MSRGKLTEKAQEISREKIGREISLRELRLMPYIQYQMMNEQRLEPNRINAEERDVLKKWRDEGHIEGGASGLSITKFFWDYINEILFETYVKATADNSDFA